MAENGILDYQGMNQAIYRGATSNIVVDTQSMSIEIGAGNTSHTSNLHFECNHDANVASVQLNSNVVTEFSRSKKLIKYPRVALSANSDSGYVASASSYYNTGVQPYQAFDVVNGGLGWESGPNSQNGNGRYSSGSTFNTTYLNDNPTLGEGGFQTTAGSTTYTGEWVQIQLPVSIQSTTHVFGNSDANSDWNLRIPQSGVILGSTNGSSWELIHSFDDTIKNATITVSHTKYYSYFRLVVLSVGTNQTLANVPEWEIFGTPEYDPEAAGVDIKMTSYPNVPNTDWLEVYYDAKDLANGSITNVDDLTPNGTNDGTATNVTVSDGAFVFNGTSSLVEKTSLSIPGSDNPFTISFWIKNDTFDATQYILRLGINQTTYQTVAIYKNSSNQIIFASWTLDFPINYTFTSNQWNHISLTYPGGGWKQSNLIAYIDGRPYTFGGNVSAGGVGGTALSLATSLTLRLGGLAAGNAQLDGSIANFRLFNRALTQDEVWQLYAYQKEYFGHGDLGMTFKAGRLGIGTSEPEAVLDVRGDVHVGGIITSNNPAFNVYRDDGDITTTDTTIVWNQVRFNRGNCYDSSTGVFHPPVDGMYFFSVFGMTDSRTNAACSFRFQYAPPTGSFDYIDALWPYQYVVASGSHIHASGSFVYFLEVGSSFRVIFHGTELLARGNTHNGFSGFLIG